jgi:hypothetical protein
METRSNQVLVGSVTLGLIAALVVFLIWLSQVGDGGEKTYDVFFTQSVEGLAKGSQVTFSGVPVGQIESINLVPDSPQFIRVRITVNENAPVYEGTTATFAASASPACRRSSSIPKRRPRPARRAVRAARSSVRRRIRNPNVPMGSP